MDIDRFAFEQAPDPVFRISADGRIRDANEVAWRWLGYARDELLGQSIWQISLDWTEASWPGIWRTLTAHPLGLAESELQRQDGQRFMVDFSVRLYEGAAGTEALLFGRVRLPRSDAVQELARLRELLDVAESLAQIGHWRYAVASGRPHWSDQVFAIFRRDPALGEPSFDEHARYVTEADWPRLREAVEHCAERGVPYALTLGIRRDDGTTGTARVYGSALTGSTSSFGELVGFVLDISEQQATEQHLLDAQRRLEVALDASGIGIYQVNLLTNEAIVDARYLGMLGYSPDEVSMTVDWWRERLHPSDAGAMYEAVEQAQAGTRDQFRGEYRMRHRDGHWIWIEDFGRICERDKAGQARLTVGVHIDISERKRIERRLSFRANHDRLTHLPNRYSFWCTLKRIHAQALRSQRAYCIAMLDLDLFKAVNDTYGHLAGDRVLQAFAALLRESVREADWVARWGGEEFIVLMPDTDRAQACQSMERLRACVAASPLPAGDQTLRITLSIGVAEHGPADQTADSVITRADNGLYQAKRLGRDRVCAVEQALSQTTTPATLRAGGH